MQALGKLKDEPGIWATERPVPSIGPLDVLVRVWTTGICGSDLTIYKWGDMVRQFVPLGTVTGHEFVGEIVEVGSGVAQYKVGDRISAEGHVGCGHCRLCREGQAHICPDARGIGVQRDGAFAEYVSVPATNVVPLPASIPDEIAALLDPLGNAVHTALSFDLVGEDVLITGAGPIGVMAAAVARHVGARSVTVTDMNSYRLDLAAKMGATRTVDVSQESLEDVREDLGLEGGFSVGLEMSGAIPAINGMIAALRNGGQMALLGVPPAQAEVDLFRVMFKGITLKGIYGRRMFQTWHKMIAMLESGLDVSPVITHRFPASEFERGFQTMAQGNCGKVLLDWRQIERA
ncbi:L-threonine 3-dehydrogenase [Shimia biformata]|uniref:L-threonine 3-dehydrogenase n=1 Tax=Shimia biformata TaxID=1294299 RepID=UPI00195174A1|nr:L-threonine 3-dehydrogenase [Shimia biformata]